MAVNTDIAGGYSATWTPPYPLTYSVRASWSGNTNYAEATSSSSALTVSGTVPLQPTLFIILQDSTYSKGETVTIDVTVFNPTGTTLEATLSVSITGPGGYYHFDFTDIEIVDSSLWTYTFTWVIPADSQAGTYVISAGLTPPELDAYDVEYVEIS